MQEGASVELEPGSAAEIVSRFGAGCPDPVRAGCLRLAGRFGLTAKAVEQWTRRKRIAGRWHLPLLREAAARGIDLTADELDHTSRKNGGRRNGGA